MPEPQKRRRWLGGDYELEVSVRILDPLGPGTFDVGIVFTPHQDCFFPFG